MTADLLDRVRASEAALGDGANKRSAIEKADHFALRKAHADVISGLMNLPHDLSVVQARLTHFEVERTAVLAKRTSLEQAIAEAPDPLTIADGRARDQERERQRQLHLSLERLAQGTLAYAPDSLYRPLAYLDGRITELTEHRDRLQRALDGVLQQADQLLVVAVAS